MIHRPPDEPSRGPAELRTDIALALPGANVVRVLSLWAAFFSRQPARLHATSANEQ